jgi:hypothetical protein
MSILAILAEKRVFFAVWRRFAPPTVNCDSPLVVLHSQEPPGKRGYSAPASIRVSPVEEWQESALVLLNSARSGHLGYALSKFGQIRAASAKRSRHQHATEGAEFTEA